MSRPFVVIIAFAIAAVSGSEASAADMALPVKAPISTPTNWTGPYLGVEGGGGWGKSTQTDPGICNFTPLACQLIAFDGSYDVRGGLAGGTLGYNWQQGSWVYGLEGDYSWTDIDGHSDVCGLNSSPFPHPCGTKLESLGTFRGRIGSLVGPSGSWLIYATGGLAFGEVQAWDSYTPASGSDFRAGWTVGAGVETMLSRNWTFKIEYLHVDLGSAQLFDVVPGLPETVSFTADIIRGGIDYKLY